MKIYEMQERLEELQGQLSIVSETANAIECSLNEGALGADQIGWALIGIIRSIDKSIKDVEMLIDGSLETRKILEKL